MSKYLIEHYKIENVRYFDKICYGDIRKEDYKYVQFTVINLNN